MNSPRFRPWQMAAALALTLPLGAAETVAFFAFDEPVGLYPSSVLSDHGAKELLLILGPGGSIVPGKFGNALSTTPQPPVKYPAGSVLFGLTQLPTPAGRTVEPMSWMNARFAALMTSGENHLRKEAAPPNATDTGLNLGAFDWTVEFWYRGESALAANASEGVIFEIGEGPRAENDHVTALLLSADRAGFVLVNQPAGTRAAIRSGRAALTTPGRWSHLAFVYRADRGELTHYVDGRPTGSPVAVKMRALPHGEEAYCSLGRDGRWERPLPGALDEFRVSRGAVYEGAFTPPGSFVATSPSGAPAHPPRVAESLRFAGPTTATVNLGTRKHLLIDDALFPEHQNVSFVPTPPDKVELAFEVEGAFRKHVVAIEDEAGVIRIYSPLANDQLGVRTSRDGLHFEVPRLATGDAKTPNITLPDDIGTPSVFIDPLAPPEERWKLVSGWRGRGIFVFTSPDGYTWKRCATAAISAAAASQSNVFYDDQRGEYVGYHRTDIGRNAFGKTERRFVMTAVESVRPPWAFRPLTQADYDRAAETMRLAKERPWYLDNGPLTPGGLGLEWPTVFRPLDGFDPDGTDVYVPKAIKYAGAPDAYLAFPCVYYHYENTQPDTRAALAEAAQGRGSGPIETQLMTSRDGVNWKRYPRPVWLNVGAVAGFDIHQTYMAHGMILRGDEIWMYAFNTEEYHSTHRRKPERRGVFRTMQRRDRIVAAEAPYDRDATLVSRPIVFGGRRLILNVDTGATGFLQVGLRRADGRKIPGFDVDDCVFVNGNELRYEVAWRGGKDLALLRGEAVQLVVRMRGARLFSLQFVDEPRGAAAKD